MVKFINLKVGGVITPINVEDVVKVKGAANGGNASTITLTYKSAATLVITSEAGANKGFGNGSATSVADVERGFWNAILNAYEMPWNLPVYPSADGEWVADFPPASQASAYVKQSDASGAGASFVAKQTQPVITNLLVPVVWATVA